MPYAIDLHFNVIKAISLFYILNQVEQYPVLFTFLVLLIDQTDTYKAVD